MSYASPIESKVTPTAGTIYFTTASLLGSHARFVPTHSHGKNLMSSMAVPSLPDAFFPIQGRRPVHLQFRLYQHILQAPNICSLPFAVSPCSRLGVVCSLVISNNHRQSGGGFAFCLQPQLLPPPHRSLLAPEVLSNMASDLGRTRWPSVFTKRFSAEYLAGALGLAPGC